MSDTATTIFINIPVPTAKEFVAGGLAGIAQVISAHPLDTIKTRLQLNPGFSTPRQIFIQTIEKEGFLGLYKGMQAPILGVAFINAVLFSAYGALKTNFNKDHKKLSLIQIAIAGSGAGIVNAFAASPVEMLKIRLQAQKSTNVKTYSGPLDVMKQIIIKDGLWHGLYRGLWVTIVKEIPAYAGFYTGYEASKRLMLQSKKELSVVETMLAGSIGGMSYWLCCYPIDMIKSRIQQNHNVSSLIMPNFKSILQEGGFPGFFRGFSISLMRSIPSAAATFTVYELALKYMN